MNIEDIKSTIVELSGSGKKVMPNARRHGIYGSFTLPGLDDMLAVRDTKQRFEDFHVPADLSGKTMIDVGSNVGAMIFEFARRGASVTGVEYRDDRVSLCRVIASHFGLDATFHQADFNDPDSYENRDWRTKKYDMLLCSSVDEYIEDLEKFYDFLHSLIQPGGTLYLESNLQGRGLSDLENMTGILERAGFKSIRFWGNGHSGGISRKRKLYSATM